jgi:hypothetical protein
VKALGFEFSVLRISRPGARISGAGEPIWNENLPGGRHRPESGWPRSGGGRDLLVPRLEGAPPARQRVLNTRGVLTGAGLDTLIFRWPLPNLVKGPS